MRRQLAALVDEFEAVRSGVTALAARTSEMRWAARAQPERWSVAECIVHLNLTALAYVPLIRESLAELPPLDAPAVRYRRDPVGWLVGLAVGPLPRVGRIRIGRVRTLAAFVPGGALDRETVLAEFNRLQDEQIALTRDADGRALGEARIQSPFDPRIHYNGYSALALLPRHQRRHLRQAEEVWAGQSEVT